MDPRSASPRTPIILDGKYILKEKVGNGSFGQIHIATCKENGATVAAKLEKKGTSALETLAKEAKILGELKNQTGFPTLYDYGKDNLYNYLVIELLGQDLEKLFKGCNYSFSLKTLLMIIDQMLTRIETLHKKGYIHRDIKPENFCISRNGGDDLYLIDFGLARSYKDLSGKHIACTHKKGLVGTARYASINNHLGMEQSRRDDLEAIGYTIMYLAKGQLPWQNLKAGSKKEKYDMIANQKLTTPIPVLCKDLPPEFATYMDYVRSLDFVDVPDYKYLKGLFRNLFLKNDFRYDFQYDWLANTQKGSLDSRDQLLKKEKNMPLGNITTTFSKDNFAVAPRHKMSVDNLPYKLILPQNRASPLPGKKINNRMVENNKGDSQNNSKVSGGDHSKDEIRARNKLLMSDHSGRNITTSSEHSSKIINMCETKLEDEEIPTEIAANASPSIKIDETKPLKAKTKNSYYIAQKTDFLQPETARGEVRRRTFIRTFSACPPTSMENKLIVLKPTTPKKKSLVDEIRRSDEDGENMSESGICEWAGHQKGDYLINQRQFMIIILLEIINIFDSRRRRRRRHAP